VPTYQVDVEVRVSASVYVHAANEDDAEEAAKDWAHDGDWANSGDFAGVDCLSTSEIDADDAPRGTITAQNYEPAKPTESPDA
jgi:hypothetical protein